jgi:hypothetical protein
MVTRGGGSHSLRGGTLAVVLRPSSVPNVAAPTFGGGYGVLRPVPNFQPFKPHRRPSSEDVVSSRLYASSGHVPGGAEVGSVELIGGGHGAGPDCFFIVLLKVICANCMGLCLVSAFSRTLYVKCTATTIMNG